MNNKKIKVPVSAKRDQSGKITFEYEEIPVSTYENWLKRCFDIYGN